MTVARHEELALVFVRRWIRSGWLRRRRQALEVELVRVPLAVDLRHDVLVVVIPGTIRCERRFFKNIFYVVKGREYILWIVILYLDVPRFIRAF